mgnify:CR=1 FL=1
MKIILFISFFILIGCSKTYEPNPWTTGVRILTTGTK